MNTKFFIVILSIIFLCFSGQAQENIDLNLQSKDTASLNIIGVYPDEFPKISIVFNAETKDGEPIWNLSRNQIQIFEGSSSCPIHCLKRISENESVKIGLVVDHSGSMAIDKDQLYDDEGNFLGTYGKYGQKIYPKDYASPIDNAKNAVKGFVRSMDIEKDFIQVVGFSDTVDKVIDFSNNRDVINKQISKMKPSSTTAFYDAVKVSLDNIKEEDGIKVIIALSDGLDNSSTITNEDVIALAKSIEVPIYTVALGQANQEALSKMSNETGGDFHYTKSSKTLSEIYDKIAKKILSIYELGYTSENLSSTAQRDFRLVYNIDSIYLDNNEIEVNLPESVVSYLKQKEDEVAQRMYTYSGLGIAAVLLAGSLVFLFRKRKETKYLKDATPEIIKSYPNPFEHEFKVEYKTKGSNPMLIISSITGMVVFSQAIDANRNAVTLQHLNLEKGTYVMSIATDEGSSIGQKIIRK